MRKENIYPAVSAGLLWPNRLPSGAVNAGRAVYWAALLLGVTLPFEAIPPLPGIGLTDDKLVLLVLVVAWLLQGRNAWPQRTEWRGLAPTLAFVGVCVASAAFAPAEYAGEAVRFVVRLLAAAFVMLIAFRLPQEQRRGLLWAVAIGAGLSSLLGIAEAVRWSPAQPLLGLFKVAPTRVGGELRVSASFQYATIASMYFEMVAPLGIVLAATSTRRWQQFLGGAIAALCTANVVLSLTRTGILTLIAVFGVLLVAAIVRRQWRRVLLPGLAGAGVLLGGAGLLVFGNPVFDMRLVSESDADWYGAAYQAPGSLDLRSNQPTTVDLDVRNEGRITWTSGGNHPFALGYRWLTADGNGVLDVPPAEVELSHDVQPGETIHLEAAVHVPDLPAGTYRLDWGMLQRDVLQFYERGWADAETRVTVDGPSISSTMPSVTPRDDEEAPWVVGRLDLWGAAGQLIAAHPVLGVGPDNFRHFYGAELGLEAWDERVQANNLYLEILADLGVVGLAAFAWVLARPILDLAKQAMTNTLALGVALAIGAFLIHGLLDAFLAFNPTALLFWLLLGLAQKPQVSGR
jgi:hypothetical protein